MHARQWHKVLNAADRAACAVMAGDGSRALHDFERLRADLNPEILARLDLSLRHVLANAANRTHARRGLFGRFGPRANRTYADALELMPDAGLLFAHSGDGYLREAAVRAMPVSASDTVAMTIILIRCNDWVTAVRAAAFERLRNVLPTATAADLSPLVNYGLYRVASWGRGGAVAGDLVMTHPAWADALRQHLMTEVNGPLARTLRLVLRNPVLDGDLMAFAQGARSSFVRAVAVQSLLEAEARWPIGTELQYVPNTMRMQRRVTLWDRRAVPVDPATQDAILRTAVLDRSVGVRKLAADHLITVGPTGHEDLCARLGRDKAGAVAERMDYFHRKWRTYRAADTGPDHG